MYGLEYSASSFSTIFFSVIKITMRYSQLRVVTAAILLSNVAMQLMQAIANSFQLYTNIVPSNIIPQRNEKGFLQLICL